MKFSAIYISAVLILAFTRVAIAQVPELPQEQTLLFEEYLGYVKKHHPLMKQANLQLSMGEAQLLKARGGFDPKVEVDHDRKKFEGTEYYDQLNATFKIPTWYGIEFKANFEENTGEFLNPNLTVPDDGLYSAGVSFSLAQGLLINDRMAALKQAKLYQEQTKAERDLLANDLIFEASNAYFEWLEATNEQGIYSNFLQNASDRFNALKRSVELGDIAAIDLVEAKITLQNRQLNLEAASLKRRKAALKISNFLWLNDIPLEVQENIIPVLPDEIVLQSSLILNGITNSSDMAENHPKLRSIDYKLKGLSVERNLKMNKLLPKLDFQYNFLSADNTPLNNFNTANYKASLTLGFPLFMRKERGDLRLTKLKIQETNFERTSTLLAIQNKIDAVNTEIESINEQNNIIDVLIQDYQTLVAAEERKFSLGESSLFLINSREKSLIDAQLKANSLSVKYLKAKAGLFNALGLSHQEGIN